MRFGDESSRHDGTCSCVVVVDLSSSFRPLSLESRDYDDDDNYDDDGDGGHVVCHDGAAAVVSSPLCYFGHRLNAAALGDDETLSLLRSSNTFHRLPNLFLKK